MPFPVIPELPEYEKERQIYEDLRVKQAAAYREVERLTALVQNLQTTDIDTLADALRRGEYNVSQEQLHQSEDDLAAATRLLNGLKLAVTKQRAAVIAACRDHQREWDAVLETCHHEALARYHATLNEFCEAQRDVAQCMDGRAMIADPREDRRKHGRFGGRNGVGIGGKWLPWADVHDGLSRYGEPLPEPADDRSGPDWLARSNEEVYTP